MSFTHTVVKTCQAPGASLQAYVTKTAQQLISIDDDTVPSDGTDTINLDFVVDKLQSLFILHTGGNATATFTYSDSATTAIPLTRDLALDWQINGYFAVPLTAGKTVTQVAVDGEAFEPNHPDSLQRFQLSALVDPT